MRKFADFDSSRVPKTMVGFFEFFKGRKIRYDIGNFEVVIKDLGVIILCVEMSIHLTGAMISL